MKLLIILLILSSNCFGQKNTIHTRDLSRVKDGTFLGTHYTTDTIHFPKVDSINVVSWANDYNDTLHFDTVKVMMFYADTVRNISTAFLTKTGNLDSFSFYYPHKEIQWQYGYRVQKLHNGWPETYFPYKEAIGYLDIDKHLLSKNIVVWKTIEIK